MIHSSVRNSAARFRRLLLVGLVATTYGAFFWNPEWMARLGADHVGIWFLDMHAVLASSDAHALGLNPYLPNPLDFLHQPHVYSDWWFGLHALGLQRSDYVWLGAALGFTFLALGLILLGTRDTRQVIWSAAILTAPPMVLGFNRGNADLFLFLVLAAAAPCLLSPRAAVRWAGLGLLLLATGLKFYPAVTGIALLARERSRSEIVRQSLVFALGTGAIILQHQQTLNHYAADAVSPTAYQVIGVDVLAQVLGWSHGSVLLVAGLLFVAAAAVYWQRAPGWPAETAAPHETISFILGAALILGCYFVTVSYAYRLVYAIFLAPLLWSAATDSRWPSWYRRISRSANVLLLVQLWGDGLARIALTGPHAPAGADVQYWSVRLVITEQVFTAALAFALAALAVPWVRDRCRTIATGATPAGS